MEASGPGNPGNARHGLPAPEADAPGAAGPGHCQEAAAVPGARTATPAPNSIWDPRRHEKRRAWPFRDAFFLSARGTTEGKVSDLKTKALVLPGGAGGRETGKLTQSPEGQPVPFSQHQVEPGVVPPQPLPVAGGEQQPGDLGVDAAVLVAYHEGVHGEGPRDRPAPAAAAGTSRPGGGSA